MPKFRVRLKVQGLELEIDGERGDIPAITGAVQQQFTGLLEAADAAADGQKQLKAAPESATGDASSKSRSTRRSRSSRASGENAEPLEFRHDSGTYGNPLQTWSVAEKCIWLLYVIKSIANVKEISAAQLTATFNDDFKAAGRLHPPLVTRELTKAKGQNPAPVGEDKEQWFLTDEGDRQAKALVQSVLNP
jgi:hypothetical protein